MNTKLSVKQEISILIAHFYALSSDEQRISKSKEIWATLFTLPYSDGDLTNLKNAMSIWIYEMQLYLDNKSDFNLNQVVHNFDSALRTVDTSFLED